MWRWILDHWFFVLRFYGLSFFFFSASVFAPWTQFFLVSTRRRFAHFLLGARLGFFFFSLSLFSHPPSFTRTTSVLVLIFHLRIVTTRGWKNWTNHGKWKWCFYVKIGLQSCLFRERRSIVREKICFVCRWKSLINLWENIHQVVKVVNEIRVDGNDCCWVRFFKSSFVRLRKVLSHVN